jgi:diguanylate cyclase (GGDEF)-like protein
MSKILIVEDDEKIRRSIKRHLAREQFEVQEAENGRLGLEALQNFPADLILLDAMMPEMNGYEMCKALKTDSSLQDIFVLMISAKAKPEDQTYGLDIGADDYLTKPFDPSELLSRVKKGLDIAYARRIGTRDETTGLFNRPFFSLQLTQEIARISRESLKLSIALIKIDSLVSLKARLASEEILGLKKSVGDVLVSHSRFTDICATWNEDEFIVLLRSTDLDGAKHFSEKIRKKVKYHDFNNNLQVTISAGIAELKETESEMIKQASTGLIQAEQSGGNCTVAV